MASKTRPFRTITWIYIGLILLLASAHISPVAGNTIPQRVASHITSGRTTTLPGLYPKRAYPGGLPATLSTPILARDEEGGNSVEHDDDEAKPDDGVPSQNGEDSNSGAPNTCASENAEIERLTQDLAHCNLSQKPQGDRAIELLTIERDDLLEKLAWMTSERDREHTSFMNEFTSGLGTNDALIATQKEAFVTKNLLEKCKYDIDRLMDCPKRKCFFIICI